MEIREIVSYYINEETKIVEVEFRLSSDSDSQIRIDNFDIPFIIECGYNVYSDDYDLFSELTSEYTDEDVADRDEENITYDIQEEDLKNFMIEFYTDGHGELPSVEIF